jgi:large subunit ribosomal protein L9
VANAGEDGKLFGSVTSMDICDNILKHGIDIDKRRIILPEDPIKRLGKYTIQIKLHPEVTANIQIEVQPADKSEDSAG